MLSLLSGVAIGVALGIVSGLIPGLHANTMAAVVSALSVPLALVFGVESVCCCLIAAMIVHTFVDTVPSTFIGVPDADTVLSVLPAHQLYLEGNGEEAVRVSALGSLWGFVFSLPLFALFFFLLPNFQSVLDWAIGLILLAAAGLLVVFSKTPLWALLLFLVSGVLGVFSMRFEYFASGILGGSEVLLPLLSGLFGIPVLIHALKSEPAAAEQRFERISISGKEICKNSVKGTIAGSIVGWLPGFSSGSANALLAFHKSGEYETRSPRAYLIATSAANTANAVLGIAALYAIGRMRSGTLAAVAAFPLPNIFLLLAAAGVAAVCGYFATVFFARGAGHSARINQKLLSGAVLTFLILLTLLLSGVFGLLILILATAVGMLPALLGTPRIYCMGCIMIPVMLFSLGFLQF